MIELVDGGSTARWQQLDLCWVTRRVDDTYARAFPRSFDYGVGFIGTQTHLHPKFNFSSDFGYFYLENVGKCKILYLRFKKKLLKCRKLWWVATPATPPSATPLTVREHTDEIAVLIRA